MATPFSAVFVRLRKEAGFGTAYQFFHKNGGAKAFGCTFPNYLRIEKGSHLPQPKRLPLLATLLRLPLRSEERRELSEAYLQTWLGSKDLVDWLLEPFLARRTAAEPEDPAKRALRGVVRGSARPLGVRQFEAIMETPESYWCYRVLVSSTEAYSPDALARLLGLKVPEVRKALESLRRQGIAKRRPDGDYFSPFAGQFLVFPDSKLVPSSMMDRVFKYNQAMIKRRGRLLDVRYCGLRADLGALEGFVPHFRDAIRSANAYSVSEKTDRSALVFVEGRIYKLLDF